MRWKIAAVSRFPTSGAARLVSVLLIVRMHSTGPEAIAEYRELAHIKVPWSRSAAAAVCE